jgi:hypothetical protein
VKSRTRLDISRGKKLTGIDRMNRIKAKGKGKTT